MELVESVLTWASKSMGLKVRNRIMPIRLGKTSW